VAWKIAADRPWIRPSRTAGRTVGHQDVAVTLDAAKLPPGETATGALRVTDVSAGRTQTVQVAVSVRDVFQYASPTATLPRKEMAFIPDDGKHVVHCTPGKRTTRTVSFFNNAATEVAWRASADLPWLKVLPSSGRAAPGQRVTVDIAAAPASADAGRHEAVLTVAEAGAAERIKLAVYALPAYRPPELPKGAAVPMDETLFERMVTAHRSWRPRWCAHALGGFQPCPAGRTERGEGVGNLYTMTAPHETTLSLAGKDFRAMSVKVDLPDPAKYKGYKYWDAGHGPPPEWVRLRFEIYVDDELRAASGWMSVADDMQTLVVGGLRGAKRLRWVARFEKYPPAAVTAAWWDIRFYR
jgi:hypothetical protein